MVTDACTCFSPLQFMQVVLDTLGPLLGCSYCSALTCGLHVFDFFANTGSDPGRARFFPGILPMLRVMGICGRHGPHPMRRARARPERNVGRGRRAGRCRHETAQAKLNSLRAWAFRHPSSSQPGKAWGDTIHNPFQAFQSPLKPDRNPF